MPAQRTFGWVQNPGDLKKLKKVVSIFQYNSAENLWLRNIRFPLLLKYNLISNTDYACFLDKIGKPNIDVEYSYLKGK